MRDLAPAAIIAATIVTAIKITRARPALASRAVKIGDKMGQQRVDVTVGE